MKNASVNSVKLIRAIVPDSVRAWQRRSPAPARVRNESFYETPLQLGRGKYRADFRIHSPELGLDFYCLGIHREQGASASGTGDEHRHSFGAREFGRWNHWDYNAEEVLPVGSFGRASILAWTASLDGG